ncbi:MULTISPECIES: DUF5590 domain-containing protein [Lysinibacillus]|uniref:Cell wall elongation regulator TseB-like domain-containing protein n=1 Tax=Lysinibacillus antri TaxID=2498145 RepID=A0A432LEG3_9BACI|nr:MULTISPECIES: DUF5590 domain-containing protein [Lysinibacillus]RUL55501.1 hypothetical protein EK386_04015 [Lysinibacillus antri]TSI09065.1 hypothetical protein FJQ64_05880 [Lysinibacillus sp. BW-2-10]
MKNWIIFISVFLLSLALVISVLVIWKSDAPFNKIEKQAEELAVSSGKLEKVSDSYVYNGNKPYVTVFGEDENGKQKAIFVPVSLEENSIQEVFLQDGITKDQALSVLNNEVKAKEILHTKLGYEEVGPVWEITYTSDSENLNYVYILFEDGEWWKRILNL